MAGKIDQLLDAPLQEGIQRSAEMKFHAGAQFHPLPGFRRGGWGGGRFRAGSKAGAVLGDRLALHDPVEVCQGIILRR